MRRASTALALAPWLWVLVYTTSTRLSQRSRPLGFIRFASPNTKGAKFIRRVTQLEAQGEPQDLEKLRSAFGAGKGKHFRKTRKVKKNKYQKFSGVQEDGPDPLDEMLVQAEMANNPQKVVEVDREKLRSEKRERNVVEYPSILEIDPQDPSTFGFLEIGTITGPHGVKGEMKLTVSTDFAEQRLSMPGTRYVKAPFRKYPRPVRLLQGRKTVEDEYLIQLEGVADREAAVKFRDFQLFVKQEERPELEEEEFLISELVGCTALYSEDPEFVIGTISDVITSEDMSGPQGLGNDLLELEFAKDPAEGDDAPTYICLIPFVKAIVPLVDLKSRIVHLDPPPGLLDLATEKEEKIVIRGYLPAKASYHERNNNKRKKK